MLTKAYDYGQIQIDRALGGLLGHARSPEYFGKTASAAEQFLIIAVSRTKIRHIRSG